MFVDLEIIFNNTYGYIQFTYEVPINLRTKIDIGDIVTVPFRNVERQAIVLKVHNDNIIVPNIKPIFKKVGNIDQFQLKYLEQIAISNNTNIGMLLHKHIEYSKISNQKKNRTGSLGIYGNKKLSTKLKKNNNVIFTSSLLEAKKVAETLKKEGKNVDFYQKTGGVKEFTNLWQNLKSFQNIIILSVNFEKIIIKDNLNFHFFNCNNFSYNLPNLNNINIVESSIIKYKIFKGHFFYYSEFPSLELFNKVNDYFLEIPDVSIDNIYGNNLMECVELFDSALSRLPVGSSARIILGLFTIARAIPILCCCPPESPAGIAFSTLKRPTLSSAALTRLLSSLCEKPLISSGRATLSKTVRSDSN